MNFLFIVAVRSLFPDARVRMEHALSGGQYCEIDKEDTASRRMYVKLKSG